MPSTPYDAKGLLKAAIRSDNPVVFIEHKATYGQIGPVPTDDYIIPLGVADIKRPGNDVTIVSYSRMAMRALEAAKNLADQHGIDVEVIDLRTLKPLDIKTVAESVRKTGRLITAQRRLLLVRRGPRDRGPVHGIRVRATARADSTTSTRSRSTWRPGTCPPPMSEPLEEASIPGVPQIVEAVKQAVGQ